MPVKQSLRSRDLKKSAKSKSLIASSQKKNTDTKTVQKNQQIFKGRVVAAKTLHTATVLLERRKTHPLYKKSYARSKKYLVEDSLGVKPGDLVEITKCRPISKNKHFRILKVIGRDMEAIVTENINADVKAAIEEVIPVEKTEEDRFSVLSDQSSDNSQPVVSKSDKPKTGKPKSENRKPKTDNNKSK